MERLRSVRPSTGTRDAPLVIPGTQFKPANQPNPSSRLFACSCIALCGHKKSARGGLHEAETPPPFWPGDRRQSRESSGRAYRSGRVPQPEPLPSLQSGQMHPSPRHAVDLQRVFPGQSEMAGLMRAMDWRKTDLGDPQTWPENLRIALSICLTSRFPMQVWWGPNYAMLYNDPYIPFLGRDSVDGTTRGKHPRSLGRSAREIWA